MYYLMEKQHRSKVIPEKKRRRSYGFALSQNPAKEQTQQKGGQELREHFRQ